MGSVNEVIKATGLSLAEYEYFKAATNILRNPALDNILEPLALTGFAVITSHNAPSSRYSDLSDLSRYLSNLNLPWHIRSIVLDRPVERVEDTGSVGMRLHQDVVSRLRAELKQQNQEVYDGNLSTSAPTQLPMKHIEKPSFSSGRPVAHGSGTFGVMREYLARTIELSLLNT